MKDKVCTQTLEEIRFDFVGSAHVLEVNSTKSQTNQKTRTCVVTGSFMTQTNEVLLSADKLPKFAQSVASRIEKKKKKSKRRQKH